MSLLFHKMSPLSFSVVGASDSQRSTEVLLRRSALSVYPCGDPWGTLLNLEIGYSWAPIKRPMGTNTKVTSASGHFKISVLTRYACCRRLCLDTGSMKTALRRSFWTMMPYAIVVPRPQHQRSTKRSKPLCTGSTHRACPPLASLAVSPGCLVGLPSAWNRHGRSETRCCARWRPCHLRPISVLRFRISEGVTQAES